MAGTKHQILANIPTWVTPGGTYVAVLEGDMATQAELDAHVNDTSDAHDASAVSVADAGGFFTGTDVEAVLQEIGADGGGGAPTDADYLVGTAHGDLSAEIVVGTTPGGELGGTWASPTVDTTHSGSSHAGVISTHEAAGDPHPGYLLESAVPGDTQVLYSNGGVIAGSANLIYNGTRFGLGKYIDLSAVTGAVGSPGTGAVGDKIALYEGLFGVGVQSSRMVLYVNTSGYLAITEVSGSGDKSSGAERIRLFPGSDAIQFGSAGDTQLQRAAANRLGLSAGDEFQAGSKIYPGTDAGATQTATGHYGGTGAPNNANGANGDFYFRSDGGALTTIYHKRVGVWVGIV